MFGKRRSLAQQRYAQFVAEGIKENSPWANLKGQVFLGDEQFVNRMQQHIQSGKDDVQIPVAQRRPKPPALAQIEKRAPDRDTAIITAHVTGGYSYQQLADYFGVHFTTVGRIVRGGACCVRVQCATLLDPMFFVFFVTPCGCACDCISTGWLITCRIFVKQHRRIGLDAQYIRR